MNVGLKWWMTFILRPSLLTCLHWQTFNMMKCSMCQDFECMDKYRCFVFECLSFICLRHIRLLELSEVGCCSKPDKNKQTINLPAISALKGTSIACVKAKCTALSKHLTEFLLGKVHWTAQNPSSCVQIAELSRSWAGHIRILQNKIAHAGQEIRKVSILCCIRRTVTKQGEQGKHWHWSMINQIEMTVTWSSQVGGVQVGAGQQHRCWICCWKGKR